MMLYPTLKDLSKKVGNRYLLVNEVAHRARKIAQKAYDNNEKLPEKPVKMAIMEIANEAAEEAAVTPEQDA
ncbi:MAG: DNA-directed RNA polymerase subunit omega [Ruminococcaceae bacterium]|nr:DNA-directed RNA polymerase subunit omega [Oscillospiraceae bacterium]